MLILTESFASCGPLNKFESMEAESWPSTDSDEGPYTSDSEFYSHLASAIEEALIDDDGNPPFSPPSEPITAPPKSEARIQAMIARVERWESPLSPLDRQQDDRVARVAHQSVNHAVIPGALVVQDHLGVHEVEPAKPGAMGHVEVETPAKIVAEEERVDGDRVVKAMKSMRHRLGTLRNECLSGEHGAFHGARQLAKTIAEAIAICKSIQEKYSCPVCKSAKGVCPVCFSRTPAKLKVSHPKAIARPQKETAPAWVPGNLFDGLAG